MIPRYSKWYASHRKFSFTAKFCIELYEDKQTIPDSIFRPFLKSLFCHSKSEEKMFKEIPHDPSLFEDHTSIQPSKQYTNEEKYNLCKSLLIHMKEEEAVVSKQFSSCKQIELHEYSPKSSD